MSRSRRSARQAGAAFERLIADYLAKHIDDRIDRRPKNGVKDRGDIGGLKHMGQRIVIECKNTSRPTYSGWLAEAETERGNDDANAAIVIHKRHGKGAASEQLVLMTVAELVALINGDRDHIDPR